jgi:hypothetical protein
VVDLKEGNYKNVWKDEIKKDLHYILQAKKKPGNVGMN